MLLEPVLFWNRRFYQLHTIPDIMIMPFYWYIAANGFFLWGDKSLRFPNLPCDLCHFHARVLSEVSPFTGSHQFCLVCLAREHATGLSYCCHWSPNLSLSAYPKSSIVFKSTLHLNSPHSVLNTVSSIGRTLGFLDLVDRLSFGGPPCWVLGEADGVLLCWLAVLAWNLCLTGAGARAVGARYPWPALVGAGLLLSVWGLGGIRKLQTLSHSYRNIVSAPQSWRRRGMLVACPSCWDRYHILWLGLSREGSHLTRPPLGEVLYRAELGEEVRAQVQPALVFPTEILHMFLKNVPSFPVYP